MADSTRGRRGPLALTLAAPWLFGACAASVIGPPAGPDRSPAADPPPAVEARSAVDANADARRRRETELLALVADANLVDMPSESRERLRATALQEVAQLRLEGGIVSDALEALSRARDAARFSGDARLVASVVRTEFLVLHYAALEAAKAGEVERSLELFDRIALLSPLPNPDRQRAAGDRLMVMELRGGDAAAARRESLDAAIARLLGPSEAPRVDPSPTSSGALLDSDARARLSAAVGREVAEAQLPSVADGTSFETGRFDPSSVVRVVSANKASVTTCYNQALRSGSGERGKLELRIVVGPAGDVRATDILTPTFKTSRLGRCIAEAVLRWRFPAFSGAPREVEVPFVLDVLR
jgi:hypothetical protein